MKGKTGIIALIALVVLTVGAGIGFSVYDMQANATSFSNAGYILIADQEDGEKQVTFTEGSVYRDGVSDTVNFKDTQGNEESVSRESFLHYEDNSMSALAQGVVVDLNDLDSAQVTNRYAVSDRVLFENTGDGYSLSNTSSDLTLDSFIWKLSDNKYMIVGENLNIHFAEDDDREAGDFVEVSYVDDGVIQLQTKDNLWMTISEECAIENMGDQKNLTVSLGDANVKNEDGDVLMDFAKMVIDDDANIPVIATSDMIYEEGEGYVEEDENVIPLFNITAKNGENGTAGESGTSGEAGAKGADGKLGQEGNMGQDGVAGNNGSTGSEGSQGDTGSTGTTGSTGATGSTGNSGGIGTAGDAGAEGNAGENGASGSQGSTGASGDEGSVVYSEDEDTVPYFYIDNLYITPTSVSGDYYIMHMDKLLTSLDEDTATEIYVVDMETGETVGKDTLTEAYDTNKDAYTAATTEAAGSAKSIDEIRESCTYELFANLDSCTLTGLQPDHEYRLVLKAYMEQDDETFSREFINQTFWTDSTGVLLDKSSATTTSVTAQIKFNSAANLDELSTVTLYLYDSYEEASAISDNGGNYYKCNQDQGKYMSANSLISRNTLSPDTVTFDELTANSTYYVRAIVTPKGKDKIVLNQILTLKTLKQKPTIETPTLCANDQGWGFLAAPTVYTDQDNSFTKWEYEFYGAEWVDEDNELKAGAVVSRNMVAGVGESVTASLDDSTLIADKVYYVRIKATYYDNEKESVIYSGLSAGVKLSGASAPVIYYANQGSSSDSSVLYSTGRSDSVSKWYDQFAGIIVIKSQGYELVVDDTHQPTLELMDSSSGMIIKTYTIYRQGTSHTLDSDSDLLGYTPAGTNDFVILLNKRSDTTTATLSGLTYDTSYTMTVTKAVLEDAYGDRTNPDTIGSCQVKTADRTPLTASVVESPKSVSENYFERKLTISYDSVLYTDDGEVQVAMNEIANIAEFDLTLVNANSDKASNNITIHLTESEFEQYKQNGAITVVSGNASGSSLAAAVRNGMIINQDLFLSVLKGSSGYDDALEELKTNFTAMKIRVSNVVDYAGNVLLDSYDSDKFGIEGDPGSRPLAVLSAVSGNEYYRKAAYDGDRTMVTSFTYYVFDLPDLMADYSEEDAYTSEIAALAALTPDGSSDQNKAAWVTSGNGTYYNYGTVSKNCLTAGTVVTTNAAGETVTRNSALGSITISTNGGQVPAIHFIPTTKEKYLAEHKDAVSSNGLYYEIYQSNMYYLMFYNDDSTESETGHQFVFCYTAWYKKTPNATSDTEKEKYKLMIYPFSQYSDSEIAEKFAGLYDTDSAQEYSVLDAPRELPEIYSLPVSSDYSGGKRTYNWISLVSDTDGAVLLNTVSDNNPVRGQANIYHKTSGQQIASEDQIGSQSIAVLSGNALDYMKDLDNLMANPSVNGSSVMTSIADNTTDANEQYRVSVRVQLYTDKYAASGSSQVFENGTYNGYSDITGKIYKYTNETDQIPTDTLLYSFYNDQTDIASEIKAVKNRASSAKGISLNVIKDENQEAAYYGVSLTLSYNDMRKISGVRFIFSDGSQTVSCDRYFWNTYYINASGDSEQFHIEKVGDTCTAYGSISAAEELGSLSGKNVSVKAQLIYESGGEGYAYINDWAYGLRGYEYNNNNEITSFGSYRSTDMGTTNTGLVLDYTLQTSVGTWQAVSDNYPRMGAMLKPEFTYSPSTAGISFTMMDASGTTIKTEPLNLKISEMGAGITGGTNRSYVPRQLAFSESITVSSSVSVPKLKPVVTYGDSSTSIGFYQQTVRLSASIAGYNSKVFFLLVEGNEKNKDTASVLSRNASGNYVTVDGLTAYKNANVISRTNANYDAFAAAMVSAEATVSGDSYQATVTLNGLSTTPDSYTFVMAAYCYDAESGTYYRLNFSDQAVSNYKVCVVNNKISANLAVSYEPTGYDTKNLITSASVSNASEGWYTLALLDTDGSFLTYLSANTTLTREAKTFALKTLQKISEVQKHENGKISYTVTGEAVSLNYGQSYKVVMNYFTDNSKTVTGKAADLTTTVMASDSFKVTDGSDQITALKGTSERVVSGNAVYMRYKFSNFVSPKAYNTENDTLYVSCNVAGHDYTAQLEMSNGTGGQISSTRSTTMTLTLPAADLDKYLAANDNKAINIVMTVSSNRQPVDGSINAEAVPQTPVYRTLTYTGSDPTVGDVKFLLLDINTMRLSLENSVGLESNVVKVNYTVEATYSDGTNQTTVTSDPTSGVYVQYNLSELVEGTKTINLGVGSFEQAAGSLVAYKVTFKFKDSLDEDLPIYSIDGGSNCSKEGNTATVIVNMNNN